MSFRTIGQVANYKPVARCGMEELAARQLGIAPSGGVAFARAGNREEKDAARQRVVDIFRPEAWPGRLNMLTMPGAQWRFERLLLGLREPGWMRRPSPNGTHFTGVENDRAIYFAAAAHMPGLETPRALIKHIRPFPFAETGVKTRHAAFFFANVDDLLAHDWERQQTHHDRHGWDAAWLDYTGQLSVERLRSIARFYRGYVRHVLVVTALKARWNRATSDAITRAGGHSAWLRRHLPGDVLHDVEYADAAPMAQLAVQKVPPCPDRL